MSTVTFHLDDGKSLELDAEAIPPGTRFIIQTDFHVTPEQAAEFHRELIRRLGPDIRFVIVSGARVIPIPPESDTA